MRIYWPCYVNIGGTNDVFVRKKREIKCVNAISKNGGTENENKYRRQIKKENEYIIGVFDWVI